MEIDNKTNFRIKLDGKLEDVDLNTFVDVLGNLSVVIHEINDALETNKALKINIKEVSTGSYDIFLILKESLIDAISQYITKENLWFGGQMVATFAGLLTIRKHLKGKKAEDVKKIGEKTEIKNIDGKTILIDNRTYKIFTENQIIDASIGKTFDVVSEDQAIEKFELYDDNNELVFESNKCDFDSIAYPAVLPEEDTKKSEEEATLTIFKVVFEKGYKWAFVYRGIKISASITDESFFQKIDEGVKFSKGDRLLVDLEIIKVFDKTIQAYVNKEYKIVKVTQHVPRGNQTKLFNKNL